MAINVARPEDVRDSFFEEVVSVAHAVDSVVVLSADHGARALEPFQEANPLRVMNAGIAEQNMVSMAAGLAFSGKLPIVYGIAPFVSLRALEQVTLDVAANNLPVTIAAIGAGFAYNVDGTTHHGVQDAGTMSQVPNLEVLCPSDPESTRRFANLIVQDPKPRYIRLEKGVFSSLARMNHDWLDTGMAILRAGCEDYVVIVTGSIAHDVLVELDNINPTLRLTPTVIEVFRLNPFPASVVGRAIGSAKKVMVVEESYPTLAPQVTLLLARMGLNPEFRMMAVPGRYFFGGGSRDSLKNEAGIDRSRIRRAMTEWVGTGSD